MLTKPAIINYYFADDKLLIFLIKKNSHDPTIFTVNFDKKLRNYSDISLRVLRLMIDFNGLSQDWQNNPNSVIIKESFELDPVISYYKRRYCPGYPIPVLGEPEYKLDTLTYLQELSDFLLPKNLRNEIADCNLLCISPHKALHLLPFHALRLDDEFVVERFGVTYIPNTFTLKYCQEKNMLRKMNRPPKSCLTINVDNRQDEGSPNLFEGDVNILRPYFNSDNYLPLVDSQASKEKVKKILHGYDVIHFGCHGVFSDANPLDSGLILYNKEKSNPISPASQLSPSYLFSAREIHGVSLNANLITLRACSSGRSGIIRGDELLGLSRAFLFAGTSSLIVGLWNVDINSSSVLLKQFYKNWCEKSYAVPKWKCLQLAQNKMLKDTSNGHNHMYHWAPFELIGDWL